MLEASVCLSLPDPRGEVMVCYSGAEKQSLCFKRTRKSARLDIVTTPVDKE